MAPKSTSDLSPLPKSRQSFWEPARGTRPHQERAVPEQLSDRTGTHPNTNLNKAASEQGRKMAGIKKIITGHPIRGARVLTPREGSTLEVPLRPNNLARIRCMGLRTRDIVLERPNSGPLARVAYLDQWN